MTFDGDGRSAFDWLDDSARERQRRGLRRELHPRPADRPVLDLAGNDYLGLSRHPETAAAAARAVKEWGTGASGSRLVTGSTELHAELERELAEFCGAAAALVFSSGFAANLGALTALSGPGSLLVSDAHNHASLIDGCRLSRAEVAVFPHGDAAAADRALSGRSQERALLVSDSVFSVDGDRAPLPELATAVREHGAGLLVDDAHGLGVVGPGGSGAVADHGLLGRPDVVVTTTLSKSLGSQGGVVLGPQRVIQHLVETARSFIFDTGLAPASTAAALAAVRMLRSNPEMARRVREVAGELAARLAGAGLPVSEPQAAVVSVGAPSPDEALAWARRCREAGVQVGCFRPPSVPDDVSRLRLTARADLAPADLDRAVEVLLSTAPTGAAQG